MIISAKPTAVEYSRELQTLTRALQAVHPAPWRHQVQQKFLDTLTRDPAMLNKYPLGPWLTISKALKQLDSKQQDSVTGINLLQQQRMWHLLPVTMAIFEEGIYIVAADEPYQQYIGQQLRAINGKSAIRLLAQLKAYFPEHQQSWLPQYLRMTELLAYLGAPCQANCLLDLSGSKVSIPKQQAIQDLQYQSQLTPVHTVRYYWQKHSSEQDVVQLLPDTLYWNLSGKALQASLQFDQAQQMAEGLLRSQAVTNIVLDFRALDAVTASIVNRLLSDVREIPEANPHRVIYAIVDESTGLLITDLLSRLQQMPEVVFVGQPMGISLSHYYDPKSIRLNKTALDLIIATRYQKYMNEEAAAPFRVSHRVSWRADDFFNANDTILNTILDLIEINQPD